MNTIMANAILKEYLTSLKERTAVNDENGVLLGIYSPACYLFPDRGQTQDDEVFELIDPEVIETRRKQRGEPRYYTWKQVLEHMVALEEEEQHRHQAEKTE